MLTTTYIGFSLHFKCEGFVKDFEKQGYELSRRDKLNWLKWAEANPINEESYKKIIEITCEM